jgi:tetratricopeptide (TPR) repeat protein
MITGCKDERSNVGDAYYKKGQYQEAIDSYSEYLILEPTHIKSLYNRGRAYQEIGEHEKAVQDFNKIIQEDPTNVNALLSLANDFYYRQKDYENAIFYADKILKQDENNEVAFNVKGKAYQKLGKLSEAMEAYNNAISVNQQYGDAYVSRGSLRLYLKQMNKACSDFQLAKSLGEKGVDELLNKYCR